MSNLEERGRILEEMFFREQEEQAKKAKAEAAARQTSIEDIAKETGIKDHAVIGAFLDHGVSAHMMVAVKLVPLVLMAWADGRLVGPAAHCVCDVSCARRRRFRHRNGPGPRCLICQNT